MQFKTWLSLALGLSSSEALRAQNQAAHFDGSRDCIVVANDAALRPATAFTVECWSGTVLDTGRLINMGDGLSGDTNRAYELSVSPPSFVGWMFFEGSDAVKVESPVSEGWSHLAMSFDSIQGIASLLVDGDLVDRETHMVAGPPLQGARIRASTYPLTFGKNNDFTVWDLIGEFDQVRIWARTLEGDEIRCLSDVRITSGNLSQFAGLVDVWNFEGSAHSESGTHHGSICGDTSFVAAEIPSLFANYFCATSPNSVGPGAHIDFLGSTRASTNDFTLQTRDCPSSVAGYFLIGGSQVHLPFGDGYLCVLGPGFIVLPPVLTDAAGVATFPLNISGAPDGVKANFQFLYADPNGASGGFNLSDAVELEFCK